MLSDTELDINGTKLKGVWIAIVLTIGTSVGGTVWTASSLYSRLEAVETREIPDTTEKNTKGTIKSLSRFIKIELPKLKIYTLIYSRKLSEKKLT